MIKKTTTIEGNKKLATQPTVSLKVPEFLYIATANARCPKAEVYIQPGDHVNRYQVIGRRHAKFFDQYQLVLMQVVAEHFRIKPVLRSDGSDGMSSGF